MKKSIITILFTLTFLFLNAQSPLERRIDFSVVQMPVKDALRQLSLASQINIAFSSDFFDKRKKVSIEVQDEPVEKILNHILKNTPTQYKLQNRQVIVTTTEPKEPQYFTISGYVSEESSGERLIAVTIYSAAHREGTTTNQYGFYSLTLPEGASEISYRYLGCEEVKEKITLKKDARKSITLKPSLSLSEVIVVEKKMQKPVERINEEYHESIEQLKKMPVLGRGNDLMKQLNFLPGVESGVAGLGGTFIRGGNVDQNLTLMDGVNIYNPNHLLGLFSVYNYSAVKSTKLYKGDFPARYGGRLASVLDVRTKDGNLKKFSGEIAPGFLNTQVSLEGPIVKNKLGFFATGRFSQLGVISKIIADVGGEEAPILRFYDFNIKLHYVISERDKVYLGFYKGQDIIKFKYNDGSSYSFPSDSGIGRDTSISTDFFNMKVNWGNRILSLRWNHLHNDQLFSNTTFTYSRFNFNLASLSDYVTYQNDSLTYFSNTFLETENNITDFGIKTDFEFIPSPKHYFRFGGAITSHGFGSGNTNLEDFYHPDSIVARPTLKELVRRYGLENELAALDVAAYAEDEIKLTESLKVNVGLRFSLFGSSENRWYAAAEPRLKIRYNLSKTWSTSASLTRANQFLHLLTIRGLALPFDIWVPSLEEIRPQQSWQETIGLQYHQPQKFKFKVEGFYKKMNSILFLKSSVFDFEDLSLSDSTFVTGSGRAYGLEISLEKTFKKLYAFSYYTWSKSERTFEEFNLGQTFPFQYDRRHSLKLGFLWNINKKIDLSFAWTYSSGAPRLYTDLLEPEDDYIPKEFLPENNGKYNESRTPEYQRLDAKINWTFIKKRGTHRFAISVYNVLNNPHTIIYEREPKLDGNGEIVGVLETPVGINGGSISYNFFLPSFNYSFKF